MKKETDATLQKKLCVISLLFLFLMPTTFLKGKPAVSVHLQKAYRYVRPVNKWWTFIENPQYIRCGCFKSKCHKINTPGRFRALKIQPSPSYGETKLSHTNTGFCFKVNWSCRFLYYLILKLIFWPIDNFFCLIYISDFRNDYIPLKLFTWCHHTQM